jgi:hypothetical protein
MSSFELLLVRHDYSIKNSVEFKPQLGYKKIVRKNNTKEQVKYKLRYLCSSIDMQELLDFLLLILVSCLLFFLIWKNEVYVLR